jgi:sulfite reductase (ferredoxin)
MLKIQNIDISDDTEAIMSEFHKYFYETELFFDPFAKSKFANYLFKAHEHRNDPADLEKTKQIIEEARLFIEAAHECNNRMLELGITDPISFNRWLTQDWRI